MFKRWSLLGVLLLAGFTVACQGTGGQSPQNDLLTALERPSGLIAYLGPDHNVYTIDQKGENAQQITNDAHLDDTYRIYGFPIWSPDGNSLAFAQFSGENGQTPTEANLLVTDKANKNLVQAYTGDTYIVYYYWSPDNQRLSFIANTPGNSLALKVAPAAGGEAETLDVGSPYYWAWAPDSQSLLIHANNNRLSILRLADRVTEQGLNIRPETFRAPAYAPDGTQLLLAGTSPTGQSALLLADASGNPLKTLTEYTTTSIAFVWSPDGQRVAYITGDDTDNGFLGRLTIVDPSGQQPPVELNDDIVTAFFWAPNSKSLAYFSPRRVDAPTPEPGKPSGSQADSFVVWSLNVLDAKSGKTREIATYLPSDRFMEVLPFFDQYHQSATIWSPDSKNLVISAQISQSEAGIWVVSASGNKEPRALAPGQLAFWSWK